MYDDFTVQHAIWDQAVQRLANSRTLQSRTGLRHLFLYLADKTLAGEAGDLKEYIIGIEAFSKPAGYDPQTDASVRVQLSRLRQCLLEYYQKECPEDAVRIEIPKGQFRLAFTLGEQAEVVRETPSSIPSLQRRLRQMIWVSGTMAAIAIIAVLGLFLSWRTHASQPGRQVLTPELRAIWGTYLNGDRPVLVALGAPLFAKYTTSETGVFFRDPRLNDWEEALASPDLSKVSMAIGGVHVTPARIYTGVGEAIGAFQLSKLLSHSRREMSLRRSHSLSLDDFKEHNVIVLGAPKHNLYLNHLPVEQQFAFYRGSIRNLRPKPGEPELFNPKFAPGYGEIEEDHALISRFPGLHGIGETTVLAGSSTEGTLAAVEFATQPRYAADLSARLRNAKGHMPSAYQIVVRAKFKAQTPIEISYVSHRLLDTAQSAAAARP